MLLLSVDYLLSLALTELAITSWSLFYLPKIALQIILLQNYGTSTFNKIACVSVEI